MRRYNVSTTSQTPGVAECGASRRLQGVAAALRSLHSKYGTVTSTGALSTRSGAGATTDALHTAFSAMAEQHVLPSLIDFYSTKAVRLSVQP